MRWKVDVEGSAILWWKEWFMLMESKQKKCEDSRDIGWNDGAVVSWGIETMENQKFAAQLRQWNFKRMRRLCLIEDRVRESICATLWISNHWSIRALIHSSKWRAWRSLNVNNTDTKVAIFHRVDSDRSRRLKHFQMRFDYVTISMICSRNFCTISILIGFNSSL